MPAAIITLPCGAHPVENRDIRQEQARPKGQANAGLVTSYRGGGILESATGSRHEHIRRAGRDRLIEGFSRPRWRPQSSRARDPIHRPLVEAPQSPSTGPNALPHLAR